MIGGFRQWEDIDDPRRNRGPAPQEQNVPGLPAATRVLRQGTTREGFYERENPKSQRIADALRQQKTASSAATTTKEGPIAFLSRMKAALTGTAEANTAEQVLSAEVGRPISRETANRAREYVEILGISPEKGLELADIELRQGSQAISPELVKEITQSGEIKPILTALNATTEENAKLAGAEFRTLAGSQLEGAAEVEGAGRNLPGGKRNPLNKEINEIMQDGYRVPVLVADATEERWAPPSKDESGKTVWKKLLDKEGKVVTQPPTVKVGKDPRTGYNKKVFDTRAAQLALINPAALTDWLKKKVDPDAYSDERSGMNKNVPRKDEFNAEVSGYSGRYVDPRRPENTEREMIGTSDYRTLAYDSPDTEGGQYRAFGLSGKEDPSRAFDRVPMSVGEAIEDIRLTNRTPIKTLREGIDVYIDDDTGKTFHKLSGIEVFEIGRNYPSDPSLVEYRIGSPTEITNEGMRKFSALIEGLPGMENKRVLVNERLNDAAVNRAQNALLQEYMSEDFRTARAKADPNTKPIHDLMRALAAGGQLPPEDAASAPAILSNRNLYGEGTGEAKQSRRDIFDQLRATSANPEVAALRNKYQAIENDPRGADIATAGMASARPQAETVPNSTQVSQLNAPEPPTPPIKYNSYEGLIDALGGEVGSPDQERALKILAQRIRARRG